MESMEGYILGLHFLTGQSVEINQKDAQRNTYLWGIDLDLYPQQRR